MPLVSKSKLQVSITILLLCGVLGVAHAQEEDLRDPLATELKAQGDEAMQSLRYAEALAAYERATEIESHPKLLFNRARALQALGRYPEALDHFEAFRSQASAELLAKAGKLDELVARLRQQITVLHIACNVKGATVLVRGVPQGVTPLSTPIRTNAGPAAIKVQAEGYLPYERQILLPGAGEEQLAIRLVRRHMAARLAVRSPIPGAVVYVDGARLGVVPAEAALVSGRHRVRVEHPDYHVAETTVELRLGESRTVAVPLEKKPGILGKWWVWAGAGALVAGGAVLVIALTSERKPTTGDIAPGVVSAPLMKF